MMQMNLKDASAAVKQETEVLLPEILDVAQKPVNGKTSYICPFCGHGKGGDGLAIIPSKNGRHTGTSLKCFGCDFTGSIIDVVMQREKVTYRQAVEELAKRLDIEIEDSAEPVQRDSKAQRHPDTQGERADFTEYHSITRDYLFRSPKALEYMQKRGITAETLQKCDGVGFDPQADPGGKGHPAPRMIFFKNEYQHYNSRVIEGEGLPVVDSYYKKMKPAGIMETGFFNYDTIHDADTSVLFVVEGEIDALSLIQAGCRAVALSSYGRSDAFAQYTAYHRPSHDVRFIIALDNDADRRTHEKVQNTANRLTDKLHAIGYAAITFPISGTYKDANDALCHDPDYLKEQIRHAMNMLDQAGMPADSLYDAQKACTDTLYDEPDKQPQQEQKAPQMTYEDYINAFNGARQAVHLFGSDRISYDPTPTGFNALDKYALNGGLYEGLYILGAKPSLGKTTFVMQIADQVAKSGKDVLIFSLEMSKAQLIAKSVSKETHEIIQEKLMPVDYAMGFVDVLRYRQPDDPATLKGNDMTQHTVIADALMRYSKYGTHIFIHESYFDVTAETIRKQIDLHKHLTGNVPLVVVDYLQIMGCEDKGKRTDKERADYNISMLKRISNDYHVPVIAVSSVSRASYSKDVSMDSMKESGGIEYGADAVIGLQFTDTTKNNDLNMSMKPREITAKILKNRFGETGTKIDYKFYSKYNRYTEIGLHRQ